MSDFLDSVQIGPADATHSIVWLHGLGADGHDFEPIVPELRLPSDLRVRFVFPHAPARPITLNNGYVMPAWFDIADLDRNAAVDHEGFTETRAAITQLIEREIERGVPSERIVLAGFSQGGAIALDLGLRLEQKLAGIMGLSTFMLDDLRAELPARPVNAATPFFVAHGEQDPVVPLALGENSRDWLVEQGIDVEWHSYAMPHSVCMEEIADISQWLQKLLRS
ncbi:MAG: dienelactone hydrolase family protein [Gammaproteobacteria bacterium]|nr:dienelactone hydrolase family protein [Gammaproteobacteria bacterium]